MRLDRDSYLQPNAGAPLGDAPRLHWRAIRYYVMHDWAYRINASRPGGAARMLLANPARLDEAEPPEGLEHIANRYLDMDSFVFFTRYPGYEHEMFSISDSFGIWALDCRLGIGNKPVGSRIRGDETVFEMWLTIMENKCRIAELPGIHDTTPPYEHVVVLDRARLRGSDPLDGLQGRLSIDVRDHYCNGSLNLAFERKADAMMALMRYA